MVISADDLGTFLEVARCGRVNEAAKHLGLSHSTVSRRIADLERSASLRLFQRHPNGWTLTSAGENLLRHAEEVESALHDARESLAAPSSSRPHTVRMLAPDGLSHYLIVRGLTYLRGKLPDTTLEVVSGNQHVDLAMREFDVAVSVEKPDTRAVSSQLLAQFELDLFATSSYLQEHPAITTMEDYLRHDFIWYPSGTLPESTYRLLEEAVPGARTTIATSQLTSQVVAAKLGLGIAFLPTWIGDGVPELTRVDGPAQAAARSYWLVIPAQLSRLPRVRAIAQCLAELVIATSGLELGGH